MKEHWRTFFGFETEPFGSDIALKNILETDDLLGVRERFEYATRIGGAALVTGEIGSGKSTALRHAIGRPHPSEWRTLHVTASSGSILELYRQTLGELGMETSIPLCLYNREFWQPLADFINIMYQDHHTISRRDRDLFKIVDDIEDIVSCIKIK